MVIVNRNTCASYCGFGAVIDGGCHSGEGIMSANRTGARPLKADLADHPPVLSMGIMVTKPGRGTKTMCKVWESLPSCCHRVNPTFLVAFIPFSKGSSFEVAGMTYVRQKLLPFDRESCSLS